MTGKHHQTETNGPLTFAFTNDHLRQAEVIIAKYPAGRQQSAVMPLLTLAQKQSGGWIPRVAMDYIAAMLGMPPVRVYEVASFYTMYRLKPTGRHIVEVCTTTPCWLRGSDAIVDACERHLGIRMGETTPDGRFTLQEVECLGACVNAPMCAVGEEFYEDLTPDSMTRLLDAFAHNESPQAGPQNGRKSSEPQGVTETIKQAGQK